MRLAVPSAPITANPKISSPTGMRLACCPSSTKVGTASGAAAVKVGKRVAISGGKYAATSVGSIVGVEAAVGVGGMSMRGSSLAPGPVSET
jgi:hypothetical protein